MAFEKPLSIRNYLEPQIAAAAGSRVAGVAKHRLQSFKDTLAREKNPEAAQPQPGLTIADYLSRRVILNHTSSAHAAGRPATSSHLSTKAYTADVPCAPAARPEVAPALERLRAPSRHLQPQSAAGDHVENSIQKAASKYNLPSELIRSVIRAESGFRADAVSPAGAKGLMQLMPETASDLGVVDPFNIQQNIDGGARYLRQMLDRFGGKLELALAAYNAGPGAVEKYDGRVPYSETREYVKRVMRYAGQKA